VSAGQRAENRPVEFYCRVPIALAVERYARRGSSSEHHPVHVARTQSVEAFEEFQMPVNLGLVIEVDTRLMWTSEPCHRGFVSTEST
jgi:hypothetical protein